MLDRIVPLPVKVMRVQVHACQFLIFDLHLDGITLRVEGRPDTQTPLRCCRSDQIDDDLVTDQGPAPPIHRDVREQTMLDLVPLAGPWGIMTNGYLQSRLVGPPLQLHLPEPKAIPIAAPAIG